MWITSYNIIIRFFFFMYRKWLPMLKDGSLQTGEFSLPVMLDPPPSNYLYIHPEVMLPGTRWVDNHKGIFNIVIEAVTSIHTLVCTLYLSVVTPCHS